MIINWTGITKDAENKEYRVKHVVVYPFKDKDILTLASRKNMFWSQPKARNYFNNQYDDCELGR